MNPDGVLSDTEKKKKLTNYITLFAVVSCSLFLAACFILSFAQLYLFFAVCIAVFAAANVLNRLNYIDAGRFLLLVTGAGLIFFLSSSFGRQSGIWSLYFPLLVGVFILFDFKEYLKILSLVLLAIALIIISEVTDYSLFLFEHVSAADRVAINNWAVPFSIVTTMLFVYQLIRVNSHAEHLLELQQVNTKSIIDNSKDSIMLVNTRYEAVAMNEAVEKSFARLFGDSFRMGVNVLDLINSSDKIPDQFKMWQHYYDRAFKGEKISFEERVPLPTGGFHYLETEFNPVIKDGQVIGAAIFIKDITERKNLQESVSSLNRRQTAIIDGSSYSILSATPDGMIASFNKGSEKLFGYTAEEVIGKMSPADLMPQREKVVRTARLSEILGRTVEPGPDILKAVTETGVTDNEWTAQTKDGRQIILSSSVSALKNEAGELTGYLMVSYDITDKKLAEAKLQKVAEEENKRAWADAGIAEISRLLRLRDDDRASFFAGVLRYIAGYISAGQASLYLVAEDEHENKILKYLSGYAIDFQKTKKILKFGEGLVGEAAIEAKTIHLKNVPEDYIRINSSLGDAKPTNIMIVPLVFEDDLTGVIEIASLKMFKPEETGFIEKASAILASSIDVMNRKARTEQLLRESQDLNEKLKTQEEELRVGNEELMEKSNLLQASEEELRVQQEELIQINTRMEEKATVLEEQNEAILMKNAELETAREAIKIKAEELEVISRYKSEFLANMSHELRTPLNSILILSKLLSDGREANLTAKQIEFAHTINRSGTDLLNLINDILDLSKIESGKIELEIEDVSFDGLAYTMQSLFTELAREKGINFKINKGAGLPATFKGDQVKTEQVLKNLLSNSFKFTPKQGTIELNFFVAGAQETFQNPHLQQSTQNICFEVKDSGIGISKEKQELIFEAFKQADGSTSRKYGGTGLGLSISKELALILGGELHLASEPDKGSSFTLILPVDFNPGIAISGFEDQEAQQDTDKTEKLPEKANVPEKAPGTKATKADPKKERSKKMLLIVDDDPAFAGILKQQAEDKGFEAIVADRGDTGWEKIQTLVPDAVLLDIGLPVMDGWTIMKKMKADPNTKDIPVHVISGNENKKRRSETGEVEFLQKPVTTDQLNHVFERIISGIDIKNSRVLIVEDSNIQSMVLKKMLGNKGFDCIVADTGHAALESIAAHMPGIVITDLSLPDMNGADLIKKLKNNPHYEHINVIIYTGKELSKKENEELSMYSDAIIIKSAHSEERLLDEATLFLRKVSREKPSSYARAGYAVSFADSNGMKGKKILLVDDDMRNIFAISKVLEDAELQVVIANDGKEALQKLSENPDVKLVLMDIMMPEMDGYEATTRIRSDEQHSKLPIIALTAKAMKGDREKSIEAGASDYISKPVDINKLMSLLRVWLS